MLMTH